MGLSLFLGDLSTVVSLDHLFTTPAELEGIVVSISSTDRGTNFVVVDDSGINLENRRRWLGYLSDIQNSDKKIRVGTKVRFLPGYPRQKGKMGRAYDIEIIQDEVIAT